MHRHDGVAALHRGELLRVVARGIVSLTVPSEVFASLLRELCLDGIANGQVQCDDGVAALHRGELLCVVTRGVVGLTVPSVALTRLLCELGFDDIADGQVQYF